MSSFRSGPIASHAETQVEDLLREMANPAKCTGEIEYEFLQLFDPNGSRPCKSKKSGDQQEPCIRTFGRLSEVQKSRIALRTIKTITEALGGYSFHESKREAGSREEERDVKGRGPWINTLVKCGLLSLNYIDNSPHHLGIADLDKEKAACNIASRLADLGHFKPALSLVQYVYNSLWPDIDKPKRKSNSLPENELNVSLTQHTTKLTSATVKRALGLVLLPRGALGEFSGERILVGIVCMGVALKAILYEPDLDDVKVLAQHLKDKHLGIETSFKKLGHIEGMEECKKKYSGYIFKIFHSASAKFSKNIGMALFLKSTSIRFFCQSSLYTFMLYQDIVASVARIYKDIGSALDYSHVVNFYNDVFDCLDTGIPTSPLELSCKWIRNCFDICLKTDDSNLKSRSSQALLTFFSSPFQIEALLDHFSSAVIAAIKNVDILLCLIYVKDPDTSVIYEETLCSLRVLCTRTAEFTFEIGHEALKCLLKSLSFHRDLVIDIFKNKDTRISNTAILEMTFELMKSCLQRFDDSKNDSQVCKSMLSSEVISYAVMLSECKVGLSKYEDKQDCGTPPIKILSYAYEASKNHTSDRHLFSIAGSAYAVARSAREAENSAEVISLLKAIIDALEKKLLEIDHVDEEKITIAMRLVDIYMCHLMRIGEYRRAADCMIDTLILLIKDKFSYKSSRSIMKLLKRLSDRFAKIQDLHSCGYMMDLMRDKCSDLSIEDTFVIGELEIHSLKTLSCGISKRLELILPIIDRLLSLIRKEEAPVTYIRMLLEKAFTARCLSPEKCANIKSKIPNSSTWCSDEILKTLEIMENKGLCCDSDTISKVMGYNSSCISAEAHFLKGITQNEKGDYDGSSLLSAMSFWAERLSRGEKDGNLAKYAGICEIYSSEKLAYAHLRSLADYFEVLDLQHHKIMCMKILIKFAPFCGFSTEKELNTTICLAYVETCFSYLKLRLTEEAGYSLHRAYTIMENKDCYEVVGPNYTATYAYYLACLGNLSKAKLCLSTAVEKASAILSRGDEDFTLNGTMHSGKYLMSHVSLCGAMIFLLSGDVVSAIHSAEASLELLVKAFIHTLPDIFCQFISMKLPKSSDNQTSNDGGTRSNTNGGNTISLSKVGGSLTELSLWGLAAKLASVYNMLGVAYIHRGSSQEASYYYSQGLEVAQLNNSKILQSHFLINLADVNSRRNLLDKSEVSMDASQRKLRQIVNSSEIPLIHLAHLKFCLGSHTFRKGDIPAAVELYKEAEVYVERCMSKTDATFLEISAPRVTSLTRSPSPDKGSTDVAGIMPGSYINYESDEVKFYLFQCMMVEIAARIGTALTIQQRILDAEATLISAESLRQRQIEQSEYYAALAKLKMFKVVQQLKDDDNHSAVFDTVFSLPLLCSTSESDAMKLNNAIGKKVRKRASSISTLCNFFRKAFGLAYLYGPPTHIHEIAHSISYLCVMQAYLPGYASISGTAELALPSAFYIDMSKGYTVKKELVSIVKDKICRSEKGPAPDSATLPRGFSKKGNLGGKSVEKDIHEEIYKYYALEDTLDPNVYEIVQKLLPSNWVAFSISVDTDRMDLYVSKYSRDEKLVFRMPINRKSLRSNTQQHFPDLNAVSRAFGDLLRENREIMNYAGSCTTSELKADWWKKRMVLNGKLRDLVYKVEDEWFGAFRTVFNSDFASRLWSEVDVELFKDELMHIIGTHIGTARPELECNNTTGYMDTRLCKIILSLGSDVSYNDLEDIVYFILNSYQYTGLHIDYSQLSLEEISDGLLDLIKRFHAKTRGAPSPPQPSRHVILILDRNLQFFPWENLSVLRDLPSCRLPTLSFLRDYLLKLNQPSYIDDNGESRYSSVDPSSCYYLLNPGRDLFTTQKTFTSYLQNEKLWNGAIGLAPKESDIIRCLEGNDIFIYFGHGGGEKYINGQNIKKLPKCPVALLLGCSSGILQLQGEFDPSGTPLNYLMSGSRAILANLWDVTDRDIDRFSTQTFKEWGLGDASLIEKQPGNIQTSKNYLHTEGDHISLSEAVMRSRNHCVLDYLTGAAPVVYGIPVYLKR